MTGLSSFLQIKDKTMQDFVDGCVSITPLHLDLTAYRVVTDLNTWSWEEETPIPILELSVSRLTE